MQQLATDLAYAMSQTEYEFSPRRFAMIVRKVQRATDDDVTSIARFIEGGEDGWPNGRENQQEWYDSHSVSEIADWVIAGLK